jgi:hypothetical protein
MVFIATFNNILVISYGSVLLVEETGVSSNTNPTKNRGWTQVLRKGRQFPLVAQELLIIPEFTKNRGSCYSIFSFICGKNNVVVRK